MTHEFKFFNMLPDQDFARRANHVLDAVMESAPSDAVEISRITKRKDGFRCSIEIFSAGGHYTAATLCHNMDLALSRTVKAIECKLALWASARFSMPETEDELLA